MLSMIEHLNLYGFSSGIAANNPDCGLGPLYLYYHPEILKKLPFTTEWRDLLIATSELRGLDVLTELLEVSTLLAEDTSKAVKKNEPFCVLAGDHSSAIGTWSGVSHALKDKGTLGLIWVDAHMDSHTPDTSLTQNIHGMPVSHLLGGGLPELCHILNKQPKLKPEYLCLIGIRSFESGEAKLLQDLNIKVFMMTEVEKQGIDAILQQALLHVRSATHIGMTIDLDAFDPIDAPGVGCREAGGIRASEFLQAVRGFYKTPGFTGLEITEFNPLLDEKAKTAFLIRDIIQSVFGPSA